jgi:hypothetical protein
MNAVASEVSLIQISTGMQTEQALTQAVGKQIARLSG